MANETLREISITINELCWQFHSKVNPIGKSHSVIGS